MLLQLFFAVVFASTVVLSKTTEREETTTVSPETARLSPNISSVSPETTRVSPNITTVSPETTRVSPNITTVSLETTTASPETTTVYTYKRPVWGGCRLPPAPPNARYEFIDPPYAEPDQDFDEMTLRIVCDRGYGILKGFHVDTCTRGVWAWKLFLRTFERTKCERLCLVPTDPNAEYRCPVKKYPPKCHVYLESGSIGEVPCPIPEGADKGYRMCKEFEPDGTVVQVVCNSTGSDFQTTCVKGDWDVEPKCDAASTTTDYTTEDFITETSIETTTGYTDKQPMYGGCKVLPNPPHGHYELLDPLYAEPGQDFDTMTVRLVCDNGYKIVTGSDIDKCDRGSWESFGRIECEPISTTALPETTTEMNTETTTAYAYKRPRIGGCFLQPNLPNGRYVPIDPPYAEPGQEFDELTLEVICDRGYGILGGRNREFCSMGAWSMRYFSKKECVRFCAVPSDPNTEYRCLVQKYKGPCFKYNAGNIERLPCPIPEGADKGYRTCKEYEPNGTVLYPVCKSGYHLNVQSNMTCLYGNWDVQANCVSDVTTEAEKDSQKGITLFE